MKLYNLSLLTLLAIITSVSSSNLFCMKKFDKDKKNQRSKKNTKEEDIAYLDRQIKIKAALEQKEQQQAQRELAKTQALQELQKKQQAEKDQATFSKYPLAPYFQHEIQQEMLPSKYHESYLSWLKSLKNLILEQHYFMQEAYVFANFWDNYNHIHNTFKEAWGQHITFFKDQPDHMNSMMFSLEINVLHNTHLFSLYMRYQDLFTYNFQNWTLTEEDYAFLNSCLEHSDEQVKWFARALLATDIFKKAELEGMSQSKKYGHKIDMLNGNINAHNQSVQDKFFTHYFAMTQLIIKASKPQSYEKEKIIYDTIKKFSQETQQEILLHINEIDIEINTVTSELEKLQQKKQKTTALPTKEVNHHNETEPEIPQILTETLSTAIKKEKKQTEQKSQQKTYFFKVQESTWRPYTSCDPRVELWSIDPEEAYKHCSKKYDIHNNKNKDRIILYHTLPWTIIDAYIKELAIACAWDAPGARQNDMSYNIPCSIEINGAEVQGVISYGTNNQKLFHRCFSERSYEKIKNDINQKKYDAEFPILTHDKEMKQQQTMRHQQTLRHDETKYTIAQNNFVVQISYTDPYDKRIVIKLIKTKTT